MFKSMSIAFLLASARLTSAAAGRANGMGIIQVVQVFNEQWTTDKTAVVGCLSTTGRFVKPQNPAVDCGIYTGTDGRLSTSAGNCTFSDPSKPANTDSKYGGNDHAWSCTPVDFAEAEYNQFYWDNDAAPYVLGHDEFNYFQDAKKLPSGNEQLDIWSFSWGSLQFGITPGHVELQWLWAPL